MTIENVLKSELKSPRFVLIWVNLSIQNVLKSELKSPRFVPFRANLIWPFWCQIGQCRQFTRLISFTHWITPLSNVWPRVSLVICFDTSCEDHAMVCIVVVAPGVICFDMSWEFLAMVSIVLYSPMSHLCIGSHLTFVVVNIFTFAQDPTGCFVGLHYWNFVEKNKKDNNFTHAMRIYNRIFNSFCVWIIDYFFYLKMKKKNIATTDIA